MLSPGAEIAFPTSHRRPHTDRVLVYTHEETVAFGLRPPAYEDLPWTLVNHRSEAIRHVLLCDLPGFDSLMGDTVKG